VGIRARCRIGTQKSTALGIHLEKELERGWFPAKVKLGVSGCPRNCAEATIKDIGIVGVDGGWEISTGGNGGVHVVATELLCIVETAEEVEEIAKAYLQHYRETGRHNERCAPWQQRVGLEKIKAVVVDDLDKRKALVERLHRYLATQDKDPWQERIADAEKENTIKFSEYKPINIPVRVEA